VVDVVFGPHHHLERWYYLVARRAIAGRSE